MNTFQFISSVGGAGAPKDNEENEGFSSKPVRLAVRPAVVGRDESCQSWFARKIMSG